MKFSYLTSALPLIFLVACSQNSKVTIDSSGYSSSAQIASSMDSTDSATWVETHTVEWQDADGIYWKLPDSFVFLDTEGNPQAKLLSSKDGKIWNDATGKSWKGTDGKLYKFGWTSRKTNDAAVPYTEGLEIQESSDNGKTWAQASDSIAWSGADGSKYRLGTSDSVWTTQP